MMNSILEPVQTRKTADDGKPGDPLVLTKRDDVALNSPEDVLDALKSRPTQNTVGKALRWLRHAADEEDGFNICQPGPKAAQIIFVLVEHVIPDFWEVWSANKSVYVKEKHLLMRCLSSAAGVGAIVSRLRLQLGVLKSSQTTTDIIGASATRPLELLLLFTESILEKDNFIASLWDSIRVSTLQSQSFLQWKECVSLLAASKLLSTAGEADLVLRERARNMNGGSWICDGHQYASWLGRNIQYMSKSCSPQDIESSRAVSQLLSKALTLGYTDRIMEASCSDLFGGNESTAYFKFLLSRLLAHEQKIVLSSALRILSRRYLNILGRDSGPKSQEDRKAISGISALILALTYKNTTLREALIVWLVGISAEAAGQSHSLHRAVLAVLSQDTQNLKETLQRSLELFGDKLYIKHTPILHQEVNTQILLMLAGYVFRLDKSNLEDVARSSLYLNAISNHLAASSERARFLGMVVGTSISDLVDPKDKQLTFSAEGLASSEGRWYRDLVTVNDPVGSIDDLKHCQVFNQSTVNSTRSSLAKKGTMKASNNVKAASKIISIDEVDDDTESEDDLLVYRKPGSDPEDEEEDPTLVNRDRLTAPVYISDLLAGLRDNENFDRHSLALRTAAELIRRKAAFGTEVSDNIEELATLLVGLSDKWEMENFQQMRLQGMIAVLVAEPSKMGQWFSKTFYNGDYSMSQRMSVLTTLGLGARELAGLGKEDAVMTGANISSEKAFPSKQLPDKLHKLYALEAAPMNALSTQLEKAMIQPMAAQAADEISGPNALKVRTFSSRMEVEKKRQKPTSNALAKVVAEGFFFPLTGRWPIHLQTYGENSTHTGPLLLSHLLRTLSLILHASGPSTLSLPQMTSEFWALLLSLRARATDPSILEALLFALLTLLNVNENHQRRLAEEHAKELLETQGWVEGVFERVGGGSEEGERIRMLAAGVLVRTRQVVERYQRVLMGDLVNFM